MTNDPRELNAAHVAAAAQTPDATEVLTSLGTYLGVPGFEPTTSGRPAEEAPPPLRKGVLPEVSPGDHDAYLEKVAGWEAFTRANADRRAREADEGGGIHPGVNGNCDANGAQQLDQASDATKKTSSSMSSSTTALVAVSVVADVRARDHSTRHAAEKVPAMYFDPCFDLSDPAVFRAVCPDERTSPDDDRSMNTSSKGGPEQRAPAPSSTLFGGATGLATQERLSQHLDKVEINLSGRSARGASRSSRLPLGYTSSTRSCRRLAERSGELAGRFWKHPRTPRAHTSPSRAFTGNARTSARSPTCSRRCRPCGSAARTSTCWSPPKTAAARSRFARRFDARYRTQRWRASRASRTWRRTWTGWNSRWCLARVGVHARGEGTARVGGTPWRRNGRVGNRRLIIRAKRETES